MDVKSGNEHLSNTLANRECILYKIHGDKNNPNDAILKWNIMLDWSVVGGYNWVVLYDKTQFQLIIKLLH